MATNNNFLNPDGTPNYPSSWFCQITQDIMKDPVIASDGHSYERKAIEQWFRTSQISPLTGARLQHLNLVPNHALRNAIEEGMERMKNLPVVPPPNNNNNNRSAGAAVAVVVPPPSKTNEGDKITINKYKVDGNNYFLRLVTSKQQSMPLHLICVLDVSGSMGLSSSEGEKEGSQFSRLDLVKHSMNTVVELLRPTDMLSIITFSDAATALLNRRVMDATGKRLAVNQIDSMTPGGGTNLWGGIMEALRLSQGEAIDVGMNVNIILQTDGEPTPDYNPPRGILPTLKSKYVENVSPNIHAIAFGYGNGLESKLLRGIAKTGMGTYQYIPDGSMVGTVFIHLVSNLLAAGVKGFALEGANERVGFVQVKHPNGKCLFVSEEVVASQLAQQNFAFVCADGREIGVEVVDKGAGDAQMKKEIQFQSLRAEFVEVLRDAIEKAESNAVEMAKERIMGLFKKLSPLRKTDARIDAICVDLFDEVDANKGQIFKSFQFWHKWGCHYLPSVYFAHERQETSNFKDEALQMYSSEYFKTLVGNGEDAFCNIKPPKPSAASAATFSAPGSVVSNVAVSMASMMQRGGACFGGDSMVLLGNGQWGRVKELRKGDLLFREARVVCVFKFNVEEDLVAFDEDLALTKYHPVQRPGGEWEFPINVQNTKTNKVGEVYNLLLDKHHVVYCKNGMRACTLAHGMVSDSVISHPYFGTDKCVKDFYNYDAKAFAEGFLVLENYCWIREGGLISGFVGNNSKPAKQRGVGNATKISSQSFFARL